MNLLYGRFQDLLMIRGRREISENVKYRLPTRKSGFWIANGIESFLGEALKAGGSKRERGLLAKHFGENTASISVEECSETVARKRGSCQKCQSKRRFAIDFWAHERECFAANDIVPPS